MPVPVTEAMAEAYALAAHGVMIFETLELDHVTAADPLRIVTNSAQDMSFPLTNGGSSELFKAAGIRVTVAGVDADGPTPMKIYISDPAGTLTKFIRDSLQANVPIAVIYRAYVSTDLTKPGDQRGGLLLFEVKRSGPGWEASLSLKEQSKAAFPRLTYDSVTFPALQEI